MKRILTLLLTVTLIAWSVVDLLPTPVAARVYSVQPTNEDSGPPTDQFTTADPVFAIFRSDIQGGEICVVDADGAESHCKTVISDSSLQWTLIAPGLPPGTYRLRATDNDPDYSFFSIPFTVTLCNPADNACAAARRMSDQVVARWKDRARLSFTGFGKMCATLELGSTFKKPKIGRGFQFARKVVEDVNEQRKDWGWEAGLLVVGLGYGLGFTVAVGGLPMQAYKPYFALAKELSCGAQQMYLDIVNDPPDPSYTTVVPPAFTTLPATGDATTDRLSLTLDRQSAFGRAQLKAFERYLGAVEAGDENSVRLQAQAIADYGDALTAEMAESAAALRAWGTARAADEDVDNPAVTQSDLDIAKTVFERVRTSGFTQDEINQLSAAGLSQEEINLIRAGYNHDLGLARVGVSAQTVVEEAATALEASIPAFNTFAREAAWVADGRAPKSLALAPANAALSVGTTHIVNASVTDGRGTPAAGVSVSLNVTGANPASLTATTNASGIATFSYTGNKEGADSLSAKAGTAASNNATVNWSIGPVNALPSVHIHNTWAEEGNNGQFQINFTDADTQDTHTATIDWGDGSTLDTYPNANGAAGFIREANGSGFVIGYHRYVESGVYEVTGRVTDSRGGVGTGRLSLTVLNRAPVLTGVALEGVNGEIVIKTNFNDAGVNDTHTAEINWGDGTTGAGTVTEANGSGSATGSHAYGAPGNYTITLTVSDDEGGKASHNVTLTVGSGGLGNSPPSVRPSNYNTYEGRGTFSAFFDDPDTLDAHTATIDWGDGSPVEPLGVHKNSNFGLLLGSHHYVDDGTFNVTITLADNHGGVDVEVSTMTVRNAEPRVLQVGSTSNNRLFAPGDTITVSGRFEDSGVRDTHTAVWDWGDGTTSPAAFTEKEGSASVSDSHVYVTPGAYLIKLVVTDDDGAVGIGEAFNTVGVYPAITTGSIKPVVTETGKISASISGLGINKRDGVINVEKPAGATVRRAYVGAATTGFHRYLLASGDVKLDHVPVSWDIVTPSGIQGFNFWGEVTDIVKAKLDSAPAGTIGFALHEANTGNIEGEVLVVIFDDPSQPRDNTVALLFGAQQTTGDTFALRFAQPINPSDPNFSLTMSLGISFGHQNPAGHQYSLIDVNGQRMTTSAGGEDDGVTENGALLTVGGLGDSPANPANPLATPTHPRSDDELYNLKPFVKAGDTELKVVTRNPSDDDNIFFAAFFLQDAAAVVGEGVVLTPVSTSNEVGAQHTLTATAQDAQGKLLQGREVTFEILSGSHAGLTGSAVTDAEGLAKFTYAGSQKGTDTIVARFFDSRGQAQTSNTVTAEWKAMAVTPTQLAVSSTSGVYGETTRLSARLSAGGAPLGGREVSFGLNGTPVGVAMTDSDGVASISNVSVAGINAGAHPNSVAASFTGDAGHGASNGTGDLTVGKATPRITWNNPADIIYGAALGAAQLNAASFVPGAFTYAPAAGTVLHAGNNQNLHVSFTPADTTNYNTASRDVSVNVTKAPLTVIADDKSKVYGAVNPPLTVRYGGYVNGEDASALGGSLRLSTTAATGSPAGVYPITARGLTSSNYAITFVDGKLTTTKKVLTVTADNKSRIYNTANPPLTFTPSGFVNGDTAATAFNGAPTLATSAQAGSSVGTYPITAAAGTLSSANYGFTFVPGTLTVNRAPTTTLADGPMFANNGAGVLTATLLDINSLPIVNRTLTLTLGAGPRAQACSATTDATGKASCRINQVIQTLGPGTVAGSFAGDVNYLASAGSTPTLIFDYPAGVGGGSFVISDLNASVGTQVTFWGAQWAKSNALSGGATPSSFKGFVNQTSTNPVSCGGTWTTGSGNSSGPPSGIPEYMAVITSSSVTKSGSTISGNVSQIVIVKVTPGYSSNPGHAGTGTVVAVLCR
ncbi:MAG: Ig-like domain-containing protein [Acidobacteria bacterium]|nr:Ig-like domain-containing protein [Acidobacteriota bacterium]